MHLLGSIYTLVSAIVSFLIAKKCFVFILGSERCKMEVKHLTGCLEKAFKIGCFRFHNFASL
jgi:hypothetical protein